MSEPTYTITLPDADRQEISRAIAKLVQVLTNARITLEASAAAPSLPSTPVEPPRASEQNPTKALEARDRWASDKAGNPYKATSKGVHPLDVHIWKLKQTDKYLRVTWQNHGAGYGDANCFDPALWPWLIKKQGEMTRLYVTQSGNYTNIVGVCA